MKSLVLILLILCIVSILCDKNARIIIVGAGASGAATASRLMENRFTNVTILEAQNRTGGRVWTTKMGNYWVDMGGQWVDGDIGNVVYDLASPLGLVQKSTDYKEMEVHKIYGSQGIIISKEYAKKILDFLLENIGNITDIGSLKTGSIGEYMRNRFYKSLLPNLPQLTDRQREEILFLMDRAQSASDSGFTWDDVSAKSLKNYRGDLGDDHVNWKERGYSTIFDILTKKIPDPEKEIPVANNTILNARVTKIDHNDDGPVKISTEDGNEYLADHVIFTGSLGVLKTKHKKIFSPSLPEKKITAIKNIGFGASAKIYLLYDEPWWEPDSHFVKFTVWDENDKYKLDMNFDDFWLVGIYSAITIEHKPNLLCLCISGYYSRKVEKVPEERFQNKTREFIRQFFGREYNITEPKEIRRTTWYQNKDVRGVYSFRSLDSDKFNARNEDLAEPLLRNGKPIIQFAGEATEERQYGTVHGAVASGFREADRLINLYSN